MGTKEKLLKINIIILSFIEIFSYFLCFFSKIFLKGPAADVLLEMLKEVKLLSFSEVISHTHKNVGFPIWDTNSM